MKKNILTIITITLGGLTGLSFTGCNHGGACFDGNDASSQAIREHRINHVKNHLADVLELTDSQVSELDRMISDLKAKHAELKSHRPEVKAQFIDAFGQDRLQIDDITRIIDSRRPEFEDLLELAAGKIVELHAMLTPEQRAKFIDELGSHEGRCPFGR